MMKQESIVMIKGEILCESGLHIGGSKEAVGIGGLDDQVIKHPITQEPYIPGSSIKGKMRCSLERRKGMENSDPCGCGKDECMVCRIFGPHRNLRHNLGPTRLIVRDALLTEAGRQLMRQEQINGNNYFEVKTETMVDRKIGTARQGSLRTYERVPAGATFSLEMVLQVYSTDKREDMLKTVREGLQWVEWTYLGKSGSRGSGKVSFRNLTLNGEPWKLDGE